MQLTIVVPVYNEGSLVKVAHERIAEEFAANAQDVETEIIFVDDGSKDDSFQHIKDIAEQHSNVKGIRFASNKGAHTAITAGFELASGDAVCFLPCDLQEPPELIVSMLEKLKAGSHIVAAVRDDRDDPPVTRFFARTFWEIARRLTTDSVPPTGAGVFLLSRKALEAFLMHKERNITLHGLFATMGFEQAFVKYSRRKREVGKSKWSIAKKLNLFADFFVAHSYLPIRGISYLGIGVAGVGFIWTLVIAFNRFFILTPVSASDRWLPFIAVMVLLLGGLQMIMIGVIGEYVWRSLDEIRKRPRYLIDDYVGAFEGNGILEQKNAEERHNES